MILHLYSGHRRAGDLQAEMEALGPVRNRRLLVLSLDLAVDPVKGNLRDLAAVLGRLGFALGPLEHARPFLTPIYG